MDKILRQIEKERQYQTGRWGTSIDNGHSVNDWVAFIAGYAGRASDIHSTPEQQREFMVKVATLAVAAIEAFDRNGGFAPRHYDPRE